MNYLDKYLERIKQCGNIGLSAAIEKTVSNIIPQYISNFSFTDHVVSLLVGDVQSGKTSHMFGLMCAAADESFMNFVLLTTDNILLQQQTFKRAERDLCDFCVCDENDYLKFFQNNLRKPAVYQQWLIPQVFRRDRFFFCQRGVFSHQDTPDIL